MLHVLGAALGRCGDFEAGRAALRSRAGSARNWACATWRSGPSATSVTWSWPPAIRWRQSGCCATAGTCCRDGPEQLAGRDGRPARGGAHAQGRDGDANETLKAVKDEWASGDASIGAPRLAVRARLQAADGFTRIALQTAERALRVVRRTDCCASRRTRCSRTPRWRGWPASTTRRSRARGGAADLGGEGLRRRRRRARECETARHDGARGRATTGACRCGELLEEVSSAEPMPGAGYCAAVTLEMAAGLVAMAARASRADWGEAEGAAAQATRCASGSRRWPSATWTHTARRSHCCGGAEAAAATSPCATRSTRAAGVPLEIAEVAVDVAALAAVVAERGDQAMRADAVAGGPAGRGAARAAATLVEVNLGTTSSDERVARARDLAGTATAAAQRARHAGQLTRTETGNEGTVPWFSLQRAGFTTHAVASQHSGRKISTSPVWEPRCNGKIRPPPSRQVG